ncbi:MAG: ABC transporter ATP-binding protein [Candidatus Harrisonbacteria bacterium]|nr:ABC transporter ATP-binding protein [Candidatus Harrisonbacteria bacterium]
MLTVEKAEKKFEHNGEESEVFRDFSLKTKEAEFIALLGPSGCGKSTLLRMIAGLSEINGGEIVVHGKKVTGPGKDRGMVFQSFTLFPWLTVAENIAFGPKMNGAGKEEQKKIIEKYLEVTGLTGFADFYPKNLSGGMQQRVAIARTLANQPTTLLMDEPFGALDSQTRSKMQEFLTEVWEKEKKLILFVTHDVEEAVFLADRVIVLSSRPMKIKKEFVISFPRPRRHELKNSSEFFQLKKELEELL